MSRPIVEAIVRFYVSAMNHRVFIADNLMWFHHGCGGPAGQPVARCQPGDIAGVEAALRSMEDDGFLTAEMTIRCGEGHDCFGNLTRAQAEVKMAAPPEASSLVCDECPFPETDADYDQALAAFFVIGRYVPTPKLLVELAPLPGVVTAGMLLDALRDVRRDVDVRDIPEIRALLGGCT